MYRCVCTCIYVAQRARICIYIIFLACSSIMCMFGNLKKINSICYDATVINSSKIYKFVGPLISGLLSVWVFHLLSFIQFSFLKEISEINIQNRSLMFFRLFVVYCIKILTHTHAHTYP